MLLVPVGSFLLVTPCEPELRFCMPTKGKVEMAGEDVTSEIILGDVVRFRHCFDIDGHIFVHQDDVVAVEPPQ